MISHDHRCIFIHIPKCAGTSIERAFGHLDGHEGLDGQDHRTIRMIEPPPISPDLFRSPENIEQMLRRVKHRLRPQANPRNLLTVTPEQYRSYFKFTFVRNPWARMYSSYARTVSEEAMMRLHGISHDIGFKAFVRKFAGRGMLRPQPYWLKSFDGAVRLDYVGRFESLRDDFGEICKHLGMKIDLPHELKGGWTDYRRHYDEETRDLVAERFRDEITKFGYVF